jgi:hypothetical protein
LWAGVVTAKNFRRLLMRGPTAREATCVVLILEREKDKKGEQS